MLDKSTVVHSADVHWWSVILFSKLDWAYKYHFMIVQRSKFRGGLTDISAITKTLLMMLGLQRSWWLMWMGETNHRTWTNSSVPWRTSTLRMQTDQYAAILGAYTGEKGSPLSGQLIRGEVRCHVNSPFTATGHFKAQWLQSPTVRGPVLPF